MYEKKNSLNHTPLIPKLHRLSIIRFIIQPMQSIFHLFRQQLSFFGFRTLFERILLIAFEQIS